MAVKTGAMQPSDTRRVIVDTTVQPKNVMFPTDAKLIHRARERLVRLAKKTGVKLRQTYVRLGKLALIKHQRYAPAKQFKRARNALRKLKTYLGRTVRDIRRQIGDDETLLSVFLWPLHQASTVLEQRQHQRGRKIYSLHAPEVECIGKGKAHRPYEFGVKVSLATTPSSARRAASSPCMRRLCPAIPMTGHTLATVIPDIENTIGNEIERILADAGYRGHNAPESHRFRVFTSGQKRRLTPAIKGEMRRRSAVEPVIGHLKAEHRMGRDYLAGEQGDAINAVLAAAGYNFSLLLHWLRQLLSGCTVERNRAPLSAGHCSRSTKPPRIGPVTATVRAALAPSAQIFPRMDWPLNRDLFDTLHDAERGGLRLFVRMAFHCGQHVRRVHFLAVVELHALADLEGPDLGVFGCAPSSASAG